VTKKAAQWGHQAADSAGRRRADSASVFQCSMNESNMSNGCGFSLGLMPVAAVAGEGDGRVGDVFQQIARRDVEFAAEGSEHVVVGAVDLAVAPTPERGVVHPCGLGQGSYCDPLSPIAALSQYLIKSRPNHVSTSLICYPLYCITRQMSRAYSKNLEPQAIFPLDKSCILCYNVAQVARNLHPHLEERGEP